MCCDLDNTGYRKKKKFHENAIGSYLAQSNIAHNYKKTTNAYNNTKESILINIKMAINV